jgi:hypothetical protein
MFKYLGYFVRWLLPAPVSQPTQVDYQMLYHNLLFIYGIIYNHHYTQTNTNNVNKIDWLIDFLVFNATFSNISAIPWRPVLVVEETGVASRVRPLLSFTKPDANPRRIVDRFVWVDR